VTLEVFFAFVVGSLRVATPLVYAAVGGVLCERAGTVNLALEGELLAGAFAAALAGAAGFGAGAAVLAALGAGAAVGLLHAALTAGFRVDHVVSGIALNLLVAGLTKFLLKAIFEASSIPRFAAELPAWGRIDALVLAAPVAAALAAVLLRGSVLGLRLRAAGESPEAAAAAGLSPARLRVLAAVLAGAVAALGGAWLALDQHEFIADMSGGRGYVALAAVIFGRWRPVAAAGAALLFGASEAAEIALQAAGVAVPAQLLHALPYVLTIVALATAVGRSRPPDALGQPLGS
jgi:simple sugar transport system permease protein